MAVWSERQWTVLHSFRDRIDGLLDRGIGRDAPLRSWSTRCARACGQPHTESRVTGENDTLLTWATVLLSPVTGAPRGPRRAPRAARQGAMPGAPPAVQAPACVAIGPRVTVGPPYHKRPPVSQAAARVTSGRACHSRPRVGGPPEIPAV